MITTPVHPSLYLPAEQVEVIRNTAAEAEKSGCLSPQQLSAIWSNNWFNLFVPKNLGGLDLSLPEALAVEEALAWADGSTGWTVTLCAGANWFAGFLQPETAAKVFSDKKVCLAGSGRPGGVAKIKGDGYEITGTWRYATGAPHATAFTANCVVEKDGIMLTNDDGSPLVQSFIFMRDEVAIYSDWHTMGMIATASHSFAVNNLYVPDNRAFTIEASQAVIPNPLYQYPFLQFAEATLTVNIAGMAARFMELAEMEFTNREQQTGSFRPAATDKLLFSKDEVNTARQQFYAAVQSSWQACMQEGGLTAQTADRVSETCRILVAACLRAVNGLYPFCGLTAANIATEINRVWRNLHTASQHTLLTPP